MILGYFGLESWIEDGCLKCFCSEHSTNCSSAQGWFASTIFNNWSLLGSNTAIQERFNGVDENGDPIEIDYDTEFLGPNNLQSQ